MPFIEYETESGIVKGYQEQPENECLLVASNSNQVAEVSAGQIERVKEAFELGNSLEYKSGRLYEVSE